ncbi:MAG: pyruvate formate lyase family protein, partial [Anaerolineales bacterium]|nr:pyruvate formate lyase family protein [Anaerolineales bacterium]
MAVPAAEKPKYQIKEPKNLSPRVQWLRDYFFKGVQRNWNNEFTGWTTGTPWDFQYEELTFYIVPETYPFFDTFRASLRQGAHQVDLHPDFWTWSLPERHAWFIKEVMVNYLPREILPGDLLAGARFNILTSTCLNEAEAREYEKLVYAKGGTRELIQWFHEHGYGNTGSTSGHLIPDYKRVLVEGWQGIHAEIQAYYDALPEADKHSKKGGQLKGMLTAATMPRDLAAAYQTEIAALLKNETDPVRHDELQTMHANLDVVPWKPAESFWEAVQSLWLTHMLVMADENYPGPGTSFGRIDQYLYPYWQHSLENGMDRESGKEILKCFWVHANTAYDALLRTGGNQGITAGYGQLITLSGLGPNGEDLTNDLTYAMLEVIDEMSPILEPKPNVRLHRDTPDALYNKVVEMIASSQGAPFLLNFDERSMAGMILQAREAGLQDLINESNVHDYAPVGCLENTMVGNDRSGTVDNNLNLLKAVELTLCNGYDMHPVVNAMTGIAEKPQRHGPATGDPRTFTTWEQFWQAYVTQTKYIIAKIVEIYDRTEEVRSKFSPTPYLSCLVKGCAEHSLDVTQGGAEIALTTIEAVTYATTVDSLLAVKHLVYDTQTCTMDELVQALTDNWEGHAVLQAQALNKTPKYGRDDDAADAMGLQVMQLWTEETWKHTTTWTKRQFRPGMLSWNYWIADSFILPASPDGRP